MEELLPMITERDGIPVTTSRVVAEQFGKQHKNVLRDIEELINQLKSELVTEDFNHPKIGEVTRTFAEENFITTTYMDAKGEARPMYLLTRDGFTLLAMGFTGARAVQFKVAYINAFNRMERLIRGGGLSSGTLQRIEERLGCLEEMTAGGRSEAGNSVAHLFLQAIREALSTGGYHLGWKYSRNKKDSPLLLGVADWDTVALKAILAYDLYAAAAHRPLKRAVLWGMLEQAGAIKPRSDLPAEVKICGKDYTVIYVNRNQIEP